MLKYPTDGHICIIYFIHCGKMVNFLFCPSSTPLLIKALWFSLGYHSSSTFTPCSLDGTSVVSIWPSLQTSISTCHPPTTVTGEGRGIWPQVAPRRQSWDFRWDILKEALLPQYVIAKLIKHWPGAASSHHRCHLGRICPTVKPRGGGQGWELEREVFENIIWVLGSRLA